MAINNFIPELWNETLMDVFEKSHVFGRVARCAIDAPITKKGDTVHISGIGDINIIDYTGADMALQPLDDAGLTLVIDQAKAFNFEVGDIDAKQASGELMGPAAKKAAYNLKDVADKFIEGKMRAEAGLSTTQVSSMKTTTIISSIAEMSLKLDEVNVPQEQQWIIIPMWASVKLLLAGVVHAQDLEGKINGFVTKQLGPDIYRSNNVYESGGYYKPLAGSYGAVAYAEQILHTEAYRPQYRFSDALKGLHVYGAKVVKPNELVLGDWQPVDETTI